MAKPVTSEVGEEGTAQRWLRRLAPLIALLVLVGLVVICRGSYFNGAPLFNPDEADLLAAGRRAALGVQPYGTYTSGTFLFLWPLLLSVFSWLGFSLTLSLAHVLSAAAYVWIAWVVWFGVARYLGWLRAALLVLPAAIYLFTGIPAPNLTGGVFDLLSLGTELLPLSLLMAGCLILITGDAAPGSKRLFLASVLAGMSVWAKPQAAALACGLLVAAVMLRYFLADRSWGRASARALASDGAVAFAGLVLPTIAFALWMAIGGTLDDFISEPAKFNWIYITARETLAGGASLPPLQRFEPLGSFVLGYPLALIWGIAGLTGFSAIRATRSSGASVAAAAVWLLPLLAAAATLLFVFPLFPHYANILYGGGAISAVLGSRIALGADPQRSGRSAAWLPFALVGVLAALIALSATARPIYRNVNALLHPPAAAGAGGADQLAQACPAGSLALVWGNPLELYAAYDWTPASRYLGPGWILLKTRRQGVYRDRLAGELTANPPTCIVEALDPSFPSPGFTPADNIKAIVPKLQPFLNRCYSSRAIKLPDGRPVTVLRWNGRCKRP